MYRHETNKLHKAARSPAFLLVVSEHAERQMADRDIARFEVEEVLKAGVVVMIELDPTGAERWRVAGRDADGHRIEVVVELLPPTMAELITVIRIG